MVLNFGDKLIRLCIFYTEAENKRKVFAFYETSSHLLGTKEICISATRSFRLYSIMSKKEIASNISTLVIDNKYLSIRERR